MAESNRSRRRRRPLAELAKIVIGAIVGGGLAVIILWYGFGGDLFGIFAPHSRSDSGNDGVQPATPSSASIGSPAPTTIRPITFTDFPQIERIPASQPSHVKPPV